MMLNRAKCPVFHFGERMFRDIGLPSTVRIGPHAYSIRCDDTTDNYLDAAHLYGQHSNLEMAIKLQSRWSRPSQCVETFLHEIMHAINWTYNLQPRDNEERMTSIHGFALASLFLDNPWLGGWIHKTLGKDHKYHG